MNITNVRVGDTVQVAGSRAEVVEKDKGRLGVRWEGTKNTRWVKAREIEGHWKRKGP